jgi:hypothetical protein
MVLYVYTPPFGVFVGYRLVFQPDPGTRLYLKPSQELIRLLRPKVI